MNEYKECLAARVLNDGNPASYRWLSRSLNVHVNLAKQMLYDFHETQNAKRPSSVHATYLVSGIKKVADLEATNGKDGEDTVMDSSPPLPSSWRDSQANEPATPIIPTRSMVLVREEELDSLKASFEHITSIHVYSVQPNAPQDLHKLAIINQELYHQTAGKDPLAKLKTYGSITNPKVRTRDNFKPETLKSIAASNLTTAKAISIEPSTAKTSTTTAAESKAKPAPEKKSGALFSSFAKAKSRDSTKSTKVEVKAEEEDESMKDVFDDDDDVDDEAEIALLEAANKANTEKLAVERKAQQEREMKLRQMMDDDEDDDLMPDADDDVDDTSALDVPSAQPMVAKEESETQNGRRRGRRRVIKKKTYTDDEGYLVTKEEAEWESFSEDEPVIKKPRITPPIAEVAGAKKKVQSKGQGNIMSFFGKR